METDDEFVARVFDVGLTSSQEDFIIESQLEQIREERL